MKVHHIGYLVKDIEGASQDFQKFGWEVLTPQIFDESRKIFIQFLKHTAGGVVELVCPAEGCELFSKRLKSLGSIPYHICYECENLEEKISELTKSDFMLIREPQVAPAIDNRRVAFLYSENIGQFELVEKIKQ